MATPVYIRLRQSIRVSSGHVIRVRDVAKVAGPSSYKQIIESMAIHNIEEKDKNIVVIDIHPLIELILKRFPHLELEIIGPNQCVVHVDKKLAKKPSLIIVSVIWVLLFIGAAMAIMNFHYDVSMEMVQQKLHFMLTGEKEEHPLWIQVPYSIGLGLGMILFFNHWFRKKFNEEPNPMEVEVFKYQEDLDHYVAINENKVEQDEDR
ncbi:stage V sporulation protein AA [Halobacillus amylolyticus]|uniref:Stage V sporulation protein AA n=1 Tax=Halobacillus amylolyticus TaxID=2932259 RepID=A0ABY4HDB6_9BACI|nr:stage V sporulation protein AA [Halobacillus amylolyticus]UOR12403.1 stage V sporulation protein AA [Halobacillus amylolyticus]